MGEDLSQGAKIGIILIILCALIAIVFSIMAIMKNITSSGVQDLQHSLGTMSNTKFDDYDQREITGAQVISACKLFADQPYMVVVYTKRMTNQANPYKYCANNIVLDTGTVSYNKTTGVLTVASTGYVTGTLPATGTFTYNNNRVNMTKKSDAAYVSNTSKFMSYLIKTTSGDVVGIAVGEL